MRGRRTNIHLGVDIPAGVMYDNINANNKGNNMTVRDEIIRLAPWGVTNLNVEELTDTLDTLADAGVDSDILGELFRDPTNLGDVVFETATERVYGRARYARGG